ncbi:unnamed protein product [Brassicogethes aeneus]|uniref:Spaetzle domain-containing protein n=1 Tax=Brassicogethes aeneus TaxID=1431903 RepID=A0A9P0B6H9_BRAAE|nr:unnamed protein product [Brassicogethes aeneus]
MNCFSVLTLLSCCVVKCMATCSHLYGHEPCKTFVPAPPGQTPPCARPGQTFCEFPDQYPGQLINYLIQKWRFDHNTILSDESKEEFSSYFLPPNPKPEYGPPGFQSFGPKGNDYLPEPIYIPKPQQPLNAGFFPERNNLVYQEQVRNGQFYTYKYPQNFPQVNRPTYNSYYYDVPHQGQGQYNNRLWKRRTDTRQKRSLKFKRSRQIVDHKFNILSSNATLNHERQKRQATINAEPLCSSTSRFIMPRAALNNKGNWMYVVNMPEVDGKYTQLVKSETCLSQTCSSLCGLPQGYSSRCEQKYVQKRLVALEGTGDKLYNDVFWFPSCCVCTLSNS